MGGIQCGDGRGGGENPSPRVPEPFPPEAFPPGTVDPETGEIIVEENEGEGEIVTQEEQLLEAENDLEDEETNGEGTDGDDFDTENFDEGDEGGVSATADENGAEASTPGASASAGGDPDEQAPVSDPQGDVVDDVVTSGPLPNTGGVPVAAGSVLALVLFGAGLLAVRLVMIWRGRRA